MTLGFQSARVVATYQDPLGSIYPVELNDLQEGLDGFPDQNLEIIADESFQNQVDAGEFSQARSDVDTSSEANDEASSEIGDPPIAVISKRREKKKKKL
ncbi:hypothetical protein Ancab_025661 [Ancistrocladus abbreviatus]